MNALQIAHAHGSALPRWRAGFAAAWGVFWLLMITVAVQDHLRHGQRDLWRPLLWEGSSCLVASAIAWQQWRRVPRIDALLHRPWAWFARALRPLPLAALLFVAAAYAIRHGVYALVGEVYRHEPWPQVFAYEALKFSIFFVLFAAIAFGIRAHEAMLAERLRAEQAQALSQRAQLLQLAQQLEPHFLFNALNTIAATVHEDAARADALLTKLAALLRATTDLARRPTATLDEELRLLEGYMAIMQERFADRVQLRWDIDPAARPCIVPTLLLQPLVENCFRHGVEQRPGKAQIVLTARREGARLVLTVEDDIGVLPAAGSIASVASATSAASAASAVPPAPPEGTGLATLRQRLAAAYGDAASSSLTAREGGGVVARVELPCGC